MLRTDSRQGVQSRAGDSEISLADEVTDSGFDYSNLWFFKESVAKSFSGIGVGFDGDNGMALREVTGRLVADESPDIEVEQLSPFR